VDLKHHAEKMADNIYNYAEYEKSLERLLAISEKDYWTQYVDINRHQVNVAKTYLWVSVALLGTYFTILGQYNNYITTVACSILFSVLGVVSAILAFGICLYAIPARNGYKAIPDQSWGEFSLLSNKLLKNKEENIYIKVLTNLINKIDKANHHNLNTNKKRALLLRKTSWVLIASFVFSLLAGITSTISTTINTTSPIKETVMPDNNDTESQNTETIPDVPTPEGPISGGSSDVSTHSQDTTLSGSIRLTESEE